MRLESNRAHSYLADVRGGFRVPVPQPGARLTLDESMSQDIACTVRSRGLAHSERPAFVRARAAAAARSELVHQIHAVACLAKQGLEALPLDGLVVFVVLELCEVAYPADGHIWPAEQILEPCQQTGLRDLATPVASQLELTEDALVINQREVSVEFVLFMDVRTVLDDVRRLPVVVAQLLFPSLRRSCHRPSPPAYAAAGSRDTS